MYANGNLCHNTIIGAYGQLGFAFGFAGNVALFVDCGYGRIPGLISDGVGCGATGKLQLYLMVVGALLDNHIAAFDG